MALSTRAVNNDTPMSAVKNDSQTSAVEKDPPQHLIVSWDGPDDPANPRNWSPTKRWTLLIMNSGITFCQAMSSTMFAPAVPQAMSDFGSENAVVAQLLVSIYVVGLAVGPLILSPLSELYGRKPIMHSTNAMFLLAAVVCAVSPNIAVLIVFRLVMGIATISIGGAYVADLMAPEERGRAMNVWNFGPVMAPIVGPIVGGYLCLATSWRWTYGLVSTTGAIWLVACFALLPETYAPRLLELKAARLRDSTGMTCARPAPDQTDPARHTLSQTLARPWQMLVHCPAVVVVSLFGATAYSYMYFMFSTFTTVFHDVYHFNTGEAGLAYLGLGVGSLAAQLAIDMFWKKQAAQRLCMNTAVTPEDHLPLLVWAGVIIATGQACYGWSLEHTVHWALPIFGTGVSGFGIVLVFHAVSAYLVQAYTLFAASAIALSMLVRCVFGLTIPLAGPRLYATLGYGWGNSLLAFLALAMTPASLCLVHYGETLRDKSGFAPPRAAQAEQD